MRRLDVLGGLTGRIRKGLRQVRLRQRAGMASVAQTRETSAVGGARRAGEAVDASRQSSSVMSRKRHSWALGTCTGAPEPRCG